jgi:hypothetical protein
MGDPVNDPIRDLVDAIKGVACAGRIFRIDKEIYHRIVQTKTLSLANQNGVFLVLPGPPDRDFFALLTTFFNFVKVRISEPGMKDERLQEVARFIAFI